SLFCLAAVGVAPAQERAAPKPAAAANVVATGTLRIEASATTNPNLANGTELNVSPTIRVSDAHYTNVSSLYGLATVSGGMMHFSVTIPYKWAVSARSDTVSVSVNIDGGFPNGSATTYFAKTFALPANGATTTLRFVGSI